MFIQFLSDQFPILGKGKPVRKTVSLRNTNISPVFIVLEQNENGKFGKIIAEETVVEA